MKKILPCLLAALLALAGCAPQADQAGQPAAQPEITQTQPEPPSSLPEDAEESASEEPPESSRTRTRVKQDTKTVTLEPEVKRIQAPLSAGEADGTFLFSYQISFEQHDTLYDDGYRATDECFAHAPVAITVLDQAGEPLQELTFSAFCDWNVEAFREYAVGGWKVLDFNFDGYQDILCLQSMGGAKANRFYVGWLWNPQSRQFEQAEIGEIYNLSVHAGEQSLRSVSAASALHHVYQIYRFVDGAFVLTNQLDLGAIYQVTDPDTGRVLENYVELEGHRLSVHATERVGGQLQNVFPMICDTEEGVQTIHHYLYGPDSIWFGENSPDFYDFYTQHS